MPSLHEIESLLTDITLALEQYDEREEAPPQELLDSLAQFVKAEEEKINAVAHVLRTLSRNAEQAELEARALRERAARFEKHRERLGRYVASVMSALGTKKLESSLNTITLMPGRERVEIVNEAEIPVECMRMPPLPQPVVDKLAITHRFKNGETVPGARLVHGPPTVKVYQ